MNHVKCQGLTPSTRRDRSLDGPCPDRHAAWGLAASSTVDARPARLFVVERQATLQDMTRYELSFSTNSSVLRRLLFSFTTLSMNAESIPIISRKRN